MNLQQPESMSAEVSLCRYVTEPHHGPWRRTANRFNAKDANAAEVVGARFWAHANP